MLHPFPLFLRACGRLLVYLSPTLALLLVLELLARVFFPTPPFDPTLPFNAYEDETRLFRESDGEEIEVRYSTNEWGLRGDPPPADWDKYYTILTLGSSTTKMAGIDDRLIWSVQLQKNLRSGGYPVWVNNAGVVGQSTHGHLRLMHELVEPVRPDAVIFLVGWIDLWLSFRSESRQNGLYFDQYRRSEWYHSDLVFALGWAYHELKPHEVRDLGLRSSYQPRLLWQKPTPLPARLESLLPSLPDYRTNLHQLIDLAQALGIEIILLTQPARFDDTPYWNWQEGIQGNVDEGWVFSGADVALMLDEFNQMTLAVCRVRKIPCFDLAQVIPADPTYFYDPIHFTEAGSTLTAYQLSEWFAREILD